MRKIGLIAGNGQFPIIFSKALKGRKVKVIAVGFKGETHENLKEHVDKIFWVELGQLQRLIEIFKGEEIQEG